MNSMRFALKPAFWTLAFLHTEQVNLRSVFFEAFFPVALNLLIAGLEYLPRLPWPRACPLLLARDLEP